MKSKRILSIILTLALACGLLAATPTTASAADIATPMVAAGERHSLALKSDGTVYAWGHNEDGPLGDGTQTNRNTPVQVSGLSGVTAIARGRSHSLALKSGTVWACGYNAGGQLGDGTNTSRLTPVQTSDLTGVTAIGGSYYQSLALKSGTVWAWGRNGYGELGDGTTTDRYTPVQVMTGVTAVSGGCEHSLALKNGTVWAWGRNRYGQLGDGTTTDRLAPVQVSGLTGVTAISAGFENSYALRGSDGTVWAWGFNFSGQVGDDTTTQRNSPVQVSGLSNVTAISAGAAFCLALKGDGTVWAWGDNFGGRLGNGDSETLYSLTSVQVSGLTGIISIAAGDYHGLAVKNDGTVWAWGYNLSGQLGDGTTTNRYAPVQVKDVGGTGWLNLKAASTTPTYALTVNSGSGSGSYAAGAIVTITADAAPSGKVFDKWTATGVTLSSPNSASTSFTMPANAVTVTATYKDSGSSTDDVWSFWDWIIYIFFFGWLWM